MYLVEFDLTLIDALRLSSSTKMKVPPAGDVSPILFELVRVPVVKQTVEWYAYKTSAASILLKHSTPNVKESHHVLARHVVFNVFYAVQPHYY